MSPIRATCPAHLILLDLITRTIRCLFRAIEVSPEDRTIVPKHIACCNTSVASVSGSQCAWCIGSVRILYQGLSYVATYVRTYAPTYYLPTLLPSFLPACLPAFLPSWVRHAVTTSMSGIELCVLPAMATDVQVSVVRTAVGSPCIYRKRVLYIAFTRVLPSLQFVARFVSRSFTYFPKVCGRRYSTC